MKKLIAYVTTLAFLSASCAYRGEEDPNDKRFQNNGPSGTGRVVAISRNFALSVHNWGECGNILQCGDAHVRRIDFDGWELNTIITNSDQQVFIPGRLAMVGNAIVTTEDKLDHELIKIKEANDRLIEEAGPKASQIVVLDGATAPLAWALLNFNQKEDVINKLKAIDPTHFAQVFVPNERDGSPVVDMEGRDPMQYPPDSPLDQNRRNKNRPGVQCNTDGATETVSAGDSEAKFSSILVPASLVNSRPEDLANQLVALSSGAEAVHPTLSNGVPLVVALVIAGLITAIIIALSAAAPAAAIADNPNFESEIDRIASGFEGTASRDTIRNATLAGIGALQNPG